jgi:hypothetical protein
MKKNVFILFTVLTSGILTSCASRPNKQARRDSKTILIGVTQKPTYPDLIKYAIKPFNPEGLWQNYGYEGATFANLYDDTYK